MSQYAARSRPRRSFFAQLTALGPPEVLFGGGNHVLIITIIMIISIILTISINFEHLSNLCKFLE